MDGNALVVQPEAATFVQMIERASRDPAVDIDKMERLLQMHERLLARQAEVAFNEALAALQTELPSITARGEIKNKSGGVQSRYAKWEDLNATIKPILTRHGFALNFRTGNEGKDIVVTGILRHKGGHSDSCSFRLPMDSSGSKNDVQGLGSSTSYGKRYVASALLNLTTAGEDNDGAGGPKRLDDGIKADFLAAADEVADQAGWNKLWSRITEATTKAGDVAAHEELRGAMARKFKALPKEQPL